MADPHADAARRIAGPIAAGSFRALVYEPDGRATCRDFADLDTARRYADDAASEVEHGVVRSYVLNADFLCVHTGKHY